MRRLSSVSSLRTLGIPESEDLSHEYLNIFETRTGTPFFQDAYVNGVRVMLIHRPDRHRQKRSRQPDARAGAEIQRLHVHLRHWEQL